VNSHPELTIKSKRLNSHMKQLVFAAAIIFLFSADVRGQATQQPSDKDLVYAAIEDYVDGLYLVQPDRIKKSVHPKLTKKGYWRPKDKTTYEPESIMTYDELVELAAKWNAKGNVPKDAIKKIEIFDVQDQTALAKLTAVWGTDYFQLAKYDGKWMIVNIVWQSHPPKPSQNN
jgi:hypothetical protein